MQERARPAGWRTRGDVDDELQHLPQTSAAEFRTAAWALYSSRTLWPRSGFYLPPVGLRGLIAVTALLAGLGGLTWGIGTGQRMDVGDVLACALFIGVGLLLGAWKLRSNRRILRLGRRNRHLEQMSREIDALVDQGVIPLAPDGWDGQVPATLTVPAVRSSKGVGRGR